MKPPPPPLSALLKAEESISNAAICIDSLQTDFIEHERVGAGSAEDSSIHSHLDDHDLNPDFHQFSPQYYERPRYNAGTIERVRSTGKEMRHMNGKESFAVRRSPPQQMDISGSDARPRRDGEYETRWSLLRQHRMGMSGSDVSP